jgi:hypothetical protein
MMNEYVASVTPEVSPLMIGTLLGVIILAVLSGYFYKTPAFMCGNGGLWGLMQTAAIVIFTMAVFIFEHYDGFVQLLINALRRNTDTSAAWADIVAIFLISIFGTAVGCGFLAIRKRAYRYFHSAKIHNRV